MRLGFMEADEAHSFITVSVDWPWGEGAFAMLM